MTIYAVLGATVNRTGPLEWTDEHDLVAANGRPLVYYNLLMIPHDLTGRVALVTGGGVGIGRAAALALAGAGAFVGVHFHQSRRGAEQTLADLEAAGGRGLLLPGDLTSENEAKS